ncbi:MAG: hypothetical protein WCW77_02430 [Patescibacteria group bacterium]|jgi:hypothetical protein
MTSRKRIAFFGLSDKTASAVLNLFINARTGYIIDRFAGNEAELLKAEDRLGDYDLALINPEVSGWYGRGPGSFRLCHQIISRWRKARIEIPIFAVAEVDAEEEAGLIWAGLTKVIDNKPFEIVDAVRQLFHDNVVNGTKAAKPQSN